MLSFGAAERYVSSGFAVMNSFTRIASSTKFCGVVGFRNLGSGMPIDACNLP